MGATCNAAGSSAGSSAVLLLVVGILVQSSAYRALGLSTRTENGHLEGDLPLHDMDP